NRSVSNHTAAFAALVNERSAELQNALRGHGNILRDALSDNAREAEELMSVSTSRILGDVTTALSKLNDSNMLLQHVLDASPTNPPATPAPCAKPWARPKTPAFWLASMSAPCSRPSAPWSTSLRPSSAASTSKWSA